jgi:hypothetical protein
MFDYWFTDEGGGVVCNTLHTDNSGRVNGEYFLHLPTRTPKQQGGDDYRSKQREKIDQGVEGGFHGCLFLSAAITSDPTIFI